MSARPRKLTPLSAPALATPWVTSQRSAAVKLLQAKLGEFVDRAEDVLDQALRGEIVFLLSKEGKQILQIQEGHYVDRDHVKSAIARLDPEVQLLEVINQTLVLEGLIQRV